MKNHRNVGYILNITYTRNILKRYRHAKPIFAHTMIDVSAMNNEPNIKFVNKLHVEMINVL